MCGRLTFTTDVSSTSMMALDMTAIAISQRFGEGPSVAGGLIVQSENVLLVYLGKGFNDS